MRESIRNFVNGSVYGMTLIIPGVSATLFAVILKFYDKLIFVVNHFREDYRGNARYLLVFAAGVATGAVLFSSLIVYLLANFLFPTMLFFTGLLTGMIPLIAAKAKGAARGLAPRNIALAALALLAILGISRAVTATALYPEYAIDAMNVSLALYVFLAGIINGATLVIPGLSGALILLIMGLYPLVVFSISAIGDFFREPGNLTLARNIGMVLAPFGIGGLIGCLAMARLMEKLLRDFNEAAYAVILGLLAGSIIALFHDHVVIRDDAPVVYLIAGGVLFLCGCAAAYILGKKH